jgi:hypothetical protein
MLYSKDIKSVCSIKRFIQVIKGLSLEYKKLELESQIQNLSMLFQVLKGD